MLVDNSKYKSRYVASGDTTEFTIEFPFLDASHVAVYSQLGTESEAVVPTTDYTIIGAGNESGGTLIFNEPPQLGTVIAIVRSVPITQLYAYTELDNFPAESHENALAKLTMICQELKESGDRAIKAPVTSDISVEDIMTTMEQNAAIVEETKEECLAALEEIHEANYAPQTQVDTLEETVTGVSNVADTANSTASANAIAIEELTNDLEATTDTAQEAMTLANQAIALVSSAISFKGAVATTGDLPSGAAAGDIYVVEADDNTYISDGECNWTEFNTINVDLALVENSTNPVAGGVVKTALDAKADDNAVMKLSGAQDITAKKTWTTANTGPEVTNTSNSLKVSLRSSDTPRAGIYDVTNGEWVIRRNENGSFTISAKVSGGTTKSLEGKTSGTLTWAGADITGDAKKTMLPLNPKMYGAVGDGTTNDSAAFTSLETYHQGKIVDLLGCTYVLNSSYDKNTYVNGAFKISGVTITKFAKIIDMREEIPTGSSSVITEVPNPDRGTGTWVTGAQGFACRGASMYVLQPYITNAAGTSVVQDPKILRYTFDSSGNAVFADKSSVSPALGHQGLAVDGSGRLITGWSNNNVQDEYFIGRFSYTKNTVLSPTKIRLFPSTYTPGNLSPTPSLSRDKRWLVARSKDADGNHVLRLWDYQAMSGTDWSNLHAREFKIPDVPASSPAVQAILMDEDRIYIVSGGNSVAKDKRLYIYDTMGRLLSKNTSFQIGYNTAAGYGTGDSYVYEPEGLNWIDDNGTQRIGFMFLCGQKTGSARHVNISRFTI